MAVESRIARVSYGTVGNIIPWDADEHGNRDRAWCQILRDFLAVNQTEWFVKIISPFLSACDGSRELTADG